FSNSPTRPTTTLRRRAHNYRQHKNRNHSTVKYTVSGEESITGKESITGSAGSINRTQESNVTAHLTPSDDNKYTGTFSTILMDPMSNMSLRGLLFAILVLLFAANISSFMYSKNYSRFAESSTKVVPSVPAVYIRDLEEQVFNISNEKVLYSVVDPE
ncbi:8608_t:CDS:1, partial [Acaulospora morrowiae]